MKKLILFCILLMSTCFVYSANYWVDDPNDCPDNYAAQNCLVGGELVCGYDDPTLYCNDPADIPLPPDNETTTSNNIAGFDGGFYLDCLYYTAGNNPTYCSPSANDCDYNSTCYTTRKRQTICINDSYGHSECGNCRSGYQDCNSDPLDCDAQTSVTNVYGAPSNWNNNIGASCTPACDSGYADCDATGVNATNGCEYQINEVCATNALNLTGCAGCTCNSGYFDCNSDLGDGLGGDGCEVQTGVTACSVGGASGTYFGCTCVVNPFNFTSGGTPDQYQQEYSTFANQSLLWGHDYGTGFLLNLTNNNSGAFYISASGIPYSTNLISCGELYTDSSGQFMCGINDSSGADTNETNRFTNLVDYDCPTGNYSYGLYTNGTLLCRDDVDTDTTIPDTNETTRINNMIATNCSGSVAIGFFINGTIQCEADDTGAGGSQWPIKPEDFINNSGTLELNWTTINATCDLRDDDTTIGNCSVDLSCDPILYKSELNSSLDNLINGTMLLSGGFTDEQVISYEQSTGGFEGMYPCDWASFNENIQCTDLVEIDVPDVWLDNTTGYYLYDNGDTVYFNETQLNLTIDAKSSNDTNFSGGGVSTGNIDLTNNDLTNVSDITSSTAINLRPSHDDSDYFTFSTISNIPTITTTGAIDLDIVGGSTTMRVNVEESTGLNWLTFGTTTTGTPYSWFYSKEPFRVYANGDADDYTLYTTINNKAQLHTDYLNVTDNVTMGGNVIRYYNGSFCTVYYMEVPADCLFYTLYNETGEYRY